MLQPLARDEHACILQCTDDRFIGITLLTLVGDDALAFEARGILGEETIGIDSRGICGICPYLQIASDCDPDIVIIRTMTRCSVDKTSASIVSHMITIKQRDMETYTLHHTADGEQ